MTAPNYKYEMVKLKSKNHEWVEAAAKERVTLGTHYSVLASKYGVSENVAKGAITHFIRKGGLVDPDTAIHNRQPGVPTGTVKAATASRVPPGFPTDSNGFKMQQPPPSGLPTDELIADRIRRFERKVIHEEVRKLIPVKMRDSLPIGILHFGDPHVDDDGTNIGLLKSHAELVRDTEGLYGANVGDTTNNWIGRLARLYAEQSTSKSDAWQIAEWFIQLVGRKWLYIVGGNHDAWSGAGDPLKWICGAQGALYQDSEVRLALRFPHGLEVRINCRHDFGGQSQWNPAHGPMKAALMGVRDHLLTCGHRHESAYGLVKDPESGIICHCLRAASYKEYDRYARDKGFRDQTLSPCALTTINTQLPETHPDLIKVWWDPFEGAKYLKTLRDEAKIVVAKATATSPRKKRA